MVRLIKNHQNGSKLILAIGDGFNDVNMIQEAHVGVGIRSVESNQAAAFADFSIVEFKDLRRLMFWHGRSQGHKSIFFIIMKLYVSFSQVIGLLANQTVNGMSAINDMDSLMLALFAVCFVNVYIVTW